MDSEIEARLAQQDKEIISLREYMNVSVESCQKDVREVRTHYKDNHQVLEARLTQAIKRVEDRHDKNYDKLESRMEKGFDDMERKLSKMGGCIERFIESDNRRHTEIKDLITNLTLDTIKSDAEIKIESIKSDADIEKGFSLKHIKLYHVLLSLAFAVIGFFAKHFFQVLTAPTP